jgi:hypothetical protein
MYVMGVLYVSESVVGLEAGSVLGLGPGLGESGKGALPMMNHHCMSERV